MRHLNSRRRFIDLETDPRSAWDTAMYMLVWLLGSLQSFILRFAIREPVWRSFDGTVHTVKTMSDSHLGNAIRMLESAGEYPPIYRKMIAERARRRSTL